jgi:hypothetical protein
MAINLIQVNQKIFSIYIDGSMKKISKHKFSPIAGKILWNSYKKFLKDIHLTNFNIMKIRVDLNTDLACEFDYFVNWERYSQQIDNGKIENSLIEDIVYEVEVLLINIPDSYSIGQYDVAIDIPPSGLFIHFILPENRLENVQFLSEGILFKHSPELNSYSFLNFSGRLRCHITGDITTSTDTFTSEVNISQIDGQSDELTEALYYYLISEFGGKRAERIIQKHEKTLEEQGVGLEQLLFYEYCTGEDVQEKLDSGLQKELFQSMQFVSEMLNEFRIDTEFDQTAALSISTGLDGITLVNRFATVFRDMFNSAYPIDAEEQIKLEITEGALEGIIKASIRRAAMAVTKPKTEISTDTQKNFIKLVPGLKRGIKQNNVILYNDSAGHRHIFNDIRNAPFDFLYFLAWKKLGGTDPGLKTTHSVSDEEIQDVCPHYKRLNRYATGWIKVYMTQERPLKSRSDMKSQINQYFTQWYRDGIIELTPKEEFQIIPEMGIELVPYDNEEYLKWLE